MTKMHELAELGQSIWFDNIRRSLMASGELQGLIDKGLRGITSNPSIFEKAVSGSSDYDAEIQEMTAQGKSTNEIYEALTTADVGNAADLMRSVYDSTDGLDGYVSLEVNPDLAHDIGGTIAEARHLFSALDRPNIFIKVPATPSGIPAITTLIGEGININVTLMFSLAQYEMVTEAYISGIEKLLEAGGDVSRVRSVASVFVSRIDGAVDKALEEIGEEELQGKIAIANSKAIYARFHEIFGGERWERLAGAGACAQRPLWASTSTKNPDYPDTLYVDSLIGPDTVNTLPPATLDAFLDHGQATLTLEADLAEARAQLAKLSDLGVELDAITRKLLDDGVDAFATAFKALINRIAEKSGKLRDN
ncbi:transaldolase [Candidatus Poribacteria bacterium]